MSGIETSGSVVRKVRSRSRPVSRLPHRLSPLFAVALGFMPAPASTQVLLETLAVGTCVRVRSPDFGNAPIVGKLVAHRGDTLFVGRDPRADAGTPVLLDDRARLEISRKHGNRALRGALIGGIVFGSIGAYIDRLEEAALMIPELLTGERPRKGPNRGMIGFLAGAGIGGLIGSGMHVDDWHVVHPVPRSLHLDARPTMSGGGALGLTVHF